MKKTTRAFASLLLLALSGSSWADYQYQYYEGDWSSLPNFDALSPVATGTVQTFDISVRQRDSQYGFRFAGVITVVTEDTYVFYTNSDDGSQLFIDDTLVVDNDGLHAPRELSGNITLAPGAYPITVTFFEQGGGEILEVFWSNSTNGRQSIPIDGVIGELPDLSLSGAWGPVIDWPHVAVSAANLPDGRVLTWSGSERETWPSTEQTYSGTWNPQTNEFVEVFHDGHNMFCAHLAMAEDGRVFVNGGRNTVNSPWTSLFDYRNDSWEQIENMPAGGRWYPTTLALADGDMFTAIGTATNQRNPERWDPVSGWQVQPGIDFNDMVLDDYFSSGSHGESRWWPLLHVAPNGKIFHSGPTPQMHWINPTGSGDYETVAGGVDDFYHKHGTTIMYDEGQLLTAGGWIAGDNIASTNQTFTVNLNGPMPQVSSAAPMIYPRKFHNGVMLPTGEVLVVGGNTSGRKFSDDGSVLEPEIWNPATGNWRLGAPMTIPRNYHSIALLLTDGRVLAAGSGYNSNSVPASTHRDGQVYSPPYLFNADGTPASRPAISSGPGIVETGATFNVTTSASVAYFSLIKMSATTHGMNTDVRYLRPTFTGSGGSYDVTLHPNPNVATPGYWMLFAVDASGVPSEAHVMRVTAVDTRLSNVALQGTVTQSSTLPSSNSFGPANAIDGDLSGSDESGSLTHTGQDNNAWWEIDLGQHYSIETLRIWNRTDCCAARLSDFYVLYSNEPFVSQDLAATRAQAGVSEIFNAGIAGRQSNFSVNDTARYLRIQLGGQNFLQLAEVQIFGSAAPPPPPPVPSEFRIDHGVLSNVGSSWQSVVLGETFVEPVVIATARYGDGQGPAVTRVRNAAGNSFEVRVQNPDDEPLAGFQVNYLVVEAGVYASDGLRLEAVRYQSSATSHNGSWQPEPRSYGQSYTNPVVVGQVMSANDADWSVFWATDGNADNPPSAAGLAVGKHVGEDSDTTRATETIGYVVLEGGAGILGDLRFEAGVGLDIVQGMTNSPPYVYSLTESYSHAVLSSAGMQGTDGGWPILFGTGGSGAALSISIDEDQIRDNERSHTTERVAYVALGTNVVELSVADLETDPAPVNTAVGYSATASGTDPVQYSWNFGAGDTPFSTSNTASHSFTEPGRHVVTLTVRDGAGSEEQVAFTQLIHLPLSASSPVQSSGLATHPNRDEVWTVNPDNHTVTVLNSSGQVQAEISVPEEPRGLAVAPDGRVWVSSKRAAAVSVINPTGFVVEEIYPLTPGTQPHGLVIAGDRVLVALEATGEVLALARASGSVIQRTAVGNRPRHLSLNADFTQLFVSLFVSPPLPGESTADPVVQDGSTSYGGTVQVLNPATLATLDTVVLRHSDRLVSEHSGPGIPNYLGPAVISPDGTSAWVPSKQDNILSGDRRGALGMTFDQTVRAVVSKIDLPAVSENLTLRVDLDNASVASNAAFDPYGLHLFTALEGNRQISVTDVHSSVEIMRFDVGRAPQSVAVSADGTRLYAHNFMDRSVSIYDVEELVHAGTASVSLLTTVNTVASENLSATVLRGKQLFYDARDDRLAALDYMSCASCHNEGEEDGRVWDFTQFGEGLRNTISLTGRSGTAHGFLHWSANFDEVQDFEGQIRGFAGGTGLMADSDFNAGTRSEPLGDPKAGLSADLDALAAYLASLDDVPESPYREPDGSLSTAAEAGLSVFATAGCHTCHTVPHLTNSSDESALEDIGSISPASGGRLGGPLVGIDIPGLLGAWSHPPYLHDGSAPTLAAAIAAHQGINLSSSEVNQLAALISELEDASEIPPPPPRSKLAGGVVSNVSSSWTTITLDNTYDSLVVVATVQYDSSALPAVARVRQAQGNQFELRVQNPSGASLAGYTVHYLAVEEGIYTQAEHGITMEAVITTAATTAGRDNWTVEPRGYAQSYANPVVVGQVMTENDANWSVFWATRENSRNRPTAAGLGAGKNVAEDSNATRAAETIAYLVIEAGSGTAEGKAYVAGITTDSVRDLSHSDGPFVTAVSGNFNVGIATLAGLDGNNGGWAVLDGAAALAPNQITLAVDEDQIRDGERNHTTEEVAYFLLQ
ncbi:MAG: galactose oxidase-like domain-containing protein [Pseudomonadota bacterium]